MRSASPRPRRLCASLVLAAVSTALGLAVLEAGLRARAHLAAPAGLGTARPDPVPPGGRARLGHVVRLSPNPRIVYELVPGLDVVFLGVPLRTNADGWRGPAVAPERTRPAVRVVGLGDSVMFGWGVAEEDAFLFRLGAALEASHPAVAWEVVNTAVPGYNTVMEVETLEAKGLRFDPDVVVLNFVGNDLGLPNFVEERPDVLSLRRSFLLDFARARAGGTPEARRRLVGVPAEAAASGARPTSTACPTATAPSSAPGPGAGRWTGSGRWPRPAGSRWWCSATRRSSTSCATPRASSGSPSWRRAGRCGPGPGRGAFTTSRARR
jgi:hypothetical protein